MNILCRLLATAIVSVLAVAHAQAEDKTTAAAPAPIPTLHCDFKSVAACGPDGTCKAGKDVAGIPLPMKVTVDFENSVVSAVDDTGYARTDKFDAAADSGDQLIIHGIDGAFGWQLVIANASEAASMTFSTADSTLTGFGSCTNK